MLTHPIVLTIIELTNDEVQEIERAKELGLPKPKVVGEKVEAFFYNIDVLMPDPEYSDMTIIISGGQEFVTYAKIDDIREAIRVSLGISRNTNV